MLLLSSRFQKGRVPSQLVWLGGFLTLLWSNYRLSLEIERRFPDAAAAAVDFEAPPPSSGSNNGMVTAEQPQRRLESNNNLNTTAAKAEEAKIAIGIISAFDWELNHSPYDFRELRELHRETWMQHPAIKSGQIKVYFVLGNQQWKKKGKPQHPSRNISTDSSLQAEMKHYGDIVLLNSLDMHNHGKNNAWYVWAANNLPNVDYHIKLDDESYVHVDNLLRTLSTTPKERFYGGTGNPMNRHFHPATGSEKHRNLPWLRGWGYIMSKDLMIGLGQCSTRDDPPSPNATELYTSNYRIPWNVGDHEDIYNAIALRLCGLDRDLIYNNSMEVQALRGILSHGCYKHAVEDPIFIHGGMRDAKGDNPFRKVAEGIFTALHKIYHPRPGMDVVPTYIKWERLRKLFLYDLHACEDVSVPTCFARWRNTSCIPQSNLPLRQSSNK